MWPPHDQTSNQSVYHEINSRVVHTFLVSAPWQRPSARVLRVEGQARRTADGAAVTDATGFEVKYLNTQVLEYSSIRVLLSI